MFNWLKKKITSPNTLVVYDYILTVTTREGIKRTVTYPHYFSKCWGPEDGNAGNFRKKFHLGLYTADDGCLYRYDDVDHVSINKIPYNVSFYGDAEDIWCTDFEFITEDRI
jgi:hypothetical protein